MTDTHRVQLMSAIGGSLLLLAACSGTSINSANAGGAQNTQTGQGETGGSLPKTSSTNSGPTGGINGTSTGGAQTSQTGSPASGGIGTGGSSSGDSQPPIGSGGSSRATGGASSSSSSSQTGGTVGQVGGNTARAGSTSTGGKTGVNASGGAAGQAAGQSGGANNRGGAGSGGQAGGGSNAGPCVGKAWPTANPTAAGPFEVAADKGVGPLAGYIPDPIYENAQQRFNVYRPKNLATSGYCHPVLVWANGHTDNPEQNPPKCVVDSGANKWCGQYLPMMNHLASHGFVVVASLSTTTSRGEPLPTIAGLNWILQQSEDSASPYYHHLDTANIGQLGHSEGGMSTCMSASEPRYKALATICGTRALTGVHTPMMFFCGGKDTVVNCSGVRDVFLTVKDQPAVFINELSADHGSWVYGGAKGVSLSSAAAWFRIHLMGDTANRKYFYGSGCTFCTDNRVQFEQNSLMTN